MVVLEGYDAAFLSLSPGISYMRVLPHYECFAIAQEHFTERSLCSPLISYVTF